MGAEYECRRNMILVQLYNLLMYKLKDIISGVKKKTQVMSLLVNDFGYVVFNQIIIYMY